MALSADTRPHFTTIAAFIPWTMFYIVHNLKKSGKLEAELCLITAKK